MNAQFETFAEFLAMGGHALYVWLAYGATALVLLGSFLMLRSARKRQMERLRWLAAASEADPAQDDVNPQTETE